jgi:hypothetical protein
MAAVSPLLKGLLGLISPSRALRVANRDTQVPPPVRARRAPKDMVRRGAAVLGTAAVAITAVATLEPAQAVDPAQPQPLGPGGTWTQVFGDEFAGTTIDESKWDPNWFGEGGVMNDVPTYASNVAINNGRLFLRLHKQRDGRVTGGLIRTTYKPGRYQLRPGGFVEARIRFEGDDVEDVYNWPAWWASGPNWPTAGEHDIAEGLGGLLKSNYHYRDAYGAHRQRSKTTPTGGWGERWHTFGLHRKTSSADVYWDGKLVNSYPTTDNGGPEELIINVGKPRNDPRPLRFGYANAVRVEYVRAWK